MSVQSDTVSTPPRHGADLAAASRRYGIPLSDWLDLSTGINPCAYPVGTIDAAAFQHLPFDDLELREAAKAYCGAPMLPIAAAGSQVLIQWLPLVRTQLAKTTGRIAVPSIGYSEHAFRWRWAGHDVVEYDPRQPAAIDDLLRREAVDVLVVINAHNPLGLMTAPEQILAWHEWLAQRDGWLIVDEAFIDPTPEFSVIEHTRRPGLIVLRSLGKFFGLAGVRCGFAFCADDLAERLRVAVGPWSVAGPTLTLATRALRDTAWQINMRATLHAISAINAQQLQKKFPQTLLSHGLFNSVILPPDVAIACEDQLARAGIRVRRVEVDKAESLLRFGLVDPAHISAWQRFDNALQKLGKS
ncbi:MAG: threonine-phosphate decarboxylase [Spongiibacteraceae bacterium]